MEKNYPPYSLTNNMLNLVSEIMVRVGELSYVLEKNNFKELRRKTRIKSIYSSLAIENNRLSLNQVEDVINGKVVIGDKKDIQEVKNALNAYNEIDNLNPYLLEDLKKAQGFITFGIERDSGMFRNHPEGVFDGDKQIFLAPPAHMVTTLMEKLFKWMNEVKDKINPLILSSIFHYEFVFIHPFSDGNGRTARLWQTALLSNWKPLFKYIPIESIIRSNQEKYYDVIQKCNLVGNSNEFIEFMLEVILDAVKEMARTTQETTQEKILNLIRDNTSITQKEMANILGMTRDGISYNIRILREKGILERIGSTKMVSGKYMIRYREDIYLSSFLYICNNY